jgi:hypothetical protein
MGRNHGHIWRCQQTLSQYGAWYLIILGLVAIAIALWSRRGLWGLLDEHLHVRLFPVGYWLWHDATPSRGRRARRTPANAKAGDQSSPI